MTLLAASCQKGLLGGQREIIPVVSSTVMTKASSDQNDAEQLLFSVPLDADNGEEYTLEAWISDTPSNVPETKGTPVTTGNIQDVYGSFKTTAFCGGQPYSGLQEATVTYSNSEWAFDNVYYWPSDGSSLTFCSVAPVGTWNKQVSNLSWNNGAEATFTYTLPSPNGSSDAFNQDDLLIAMDTQSAGTSGEAEIKFHHALTFVDFIVGSLKDVTINSISLKNFYGTGTCTYTPGSTPSFSWSSPSNKNTYVQDFGQKIESSTTDGYSIGDWSKTFMMIPQQLPSDAEIVITYNTDKTVSYKIGADNTTKDKSGNLINNWSPYAGKSITFKVNKKIEPIDIIFVLDESDSKYNVNTRLNTAYQTFIESIKNNGNGQNVYVGLITFATSATLKTDGLLDVSKKYDELHNLSIPVGSDTKVNVALDKAYEWVNNKSYESHKKYVIVFCDGGPGGNSNYGLYDNAKLALDKSKDIKAKANVFVVISLASLTSTILDKDKGTNKQIKVSDYYNRLSSKYPNAYYTYTKMSTPGGDQYTITLYNWDSAVDGTFYFGYEKGNDFTPAFTSIYNIIFN